MANGALTYVQVELLPEGDVEAPPALSNRSHQRPLDRETDLSDALERGSRKAVARHPLRLSSGKHLLEIEHDISSV